MALPTDLHANDRSGVHRCRHRSPLKVLPVASRAARPTGDPHSSILTGGSSSPEVRHGLILLVVLAAVAARYAAFSPFAIHHPDEAIQYLEQAHRLVFGSGVVPWEYRLGMRSWLVPSLLAGPMWLGDRLAPASLLYVVLPRAACALVALSPLWAAWRIGRTISPAHALVALAVVALWPESVYFSVHILTETLSTAALLPAAALLIDRQHETPRRTTMAGALLATAVVLRFQYAPAALVLAALTLRGRWPAWRAIAAGAILPLLASAAIDLAMGQRPYAWMVANIRQNLIEHQSARFGEWPAYAYLEMLWLGWSFAIAPILWLAWYGARRFPTLAAVALVNVAIHLLIGHKEYRFLLLSTQITIVLAAIGSVDVIASLRLAFRRPWAVPAIAIAGWILVAAAMLALGLGDPGWRRYVPAYSLAWQAHRRGACGLAIFAGTTWPPVGQTFLHGPTPVYYFNGPTPRREHDLVAAAAPAFNALVAPPGRSSVPSVYRTIACAGGSVPERLCLAMRPGGCATNALAGRLRMQQVLNRNGY